MIARRRITKAQKAEVLARDGWLCFCGKVLGCRIEFDHVLALSLGGDNETDNLRGTHPVCHLRLKTSDDRRRWVKAGRQSKLRLDVPRERSKRGFPKGNTKPALWLSVESEL